MYRSLCTVQVIHLRRLPGDIDDLGLVALAPEAGKPWHLGYLRGISVSTKRAIQSGAAEKACRTMYDAVVGNPIEVVNSGPPYLSNLSREKHARRVCMHAWQRVLEGRGDSGKGCLTRLKSCVGYPAGFLGTG